MSAASIAVRCDSASSADGAGAALPTRSGIAGRRRRWYGGVGGDVELRPDLQLATHRLDRLTESSEADVLAVLHLRDRGLLHAQQRSELRLGQPGHLAKVAQHDLARRSGMHSIAKQEKHAGLCFCQGRVGLFGPLSVAALSRRRNSESSFRAPLDDHCVSAQRQVPKPVHLFAGCCLNHSQACCGRAQREHDSVVTWRR